MRIGYLLDVHNGGYDPPIPEPRRVYETMDAMIEECIVAERYGFHSIQVPHRHNRTECYFPGPEQVLTILARETERVAIGAFAYVSSVYHPMRAAEQFSVIDNLSQGRLYTTMAKGFLPRYWGQYGMPAKGALGRFLETLEIWRLAWEGERFTFEGEHWQVEDGQLVPQPYQRGGWPIWGGGNVAEAAIRRSAEYATAWTCDALPLRSDTWAEQAGIYRERATELGKEPFIVLPRNGWVGDSYGRAVEDFGDHYLRDMRFYYRGGMFVHHPDFQREEDIVAERALPHLVIGSRDDCIERIERYEEDFGIDYISMRFRVPTDPLEKTREQIQRFGEEVVSYFNKKDPPPDHPALPAACRW